MRLGLEDPHAQTEPRRRRKIVTAHGAAFNGQIVMVGYRAHCEECGYLSHVVTWPSSARRLFDKHDCEPEPAA